MALSPIDPTGGIGKINPLIDPAKLARTGGVSGADFKQFLLNNLNQVNAMQNDADQMVENLVTGKETDITKVMGSVEKADVAFQTLMAVRNKLVESYQEILRMRL